MGDIIAQLHDGTELQFPDGTKPEVIQKAVKTYLSRQKGASSATTTPATPNPKLAASKARTQGILDSMLKSQGITKEQAKAQGVHPAWEKAHAQNENTQSRAIHDAAQKAIHDAEVYRMHGAGMGDDKKRVAAEAAAANQSSARLQSILPDRGTLLNQIQPNFDHTLTQQQGVKGAIRKTAAGLANSIPDLAAIALTDGAAELPELAGQSLLTRGFQAQQIKGLIEEAGDSNIRETDPRKYYTSLVLQSLLAASPDLTKGASKAITKVAENKKATSTTNTSGGPSISAKDAAARDSAAKFAADRKAKSDAAAKAKRAAEIARVKVKPAAKAPDVPQVKPKAEPKPVEPPKSAITPEHVKAASKDGFTRAADLFAIAKKANPKLTKEEFAQQLYDFHKAHAGEGGTHNYEGGSGNVPAKDIFIAKDNTDNDVRYYGFSEKTSPKTEAPPVAEPLEVKPTEPPPSETAFKPALPKAEELPKASPTDGHNTTNEIVNRARASMGIKDLPDAQRKQWASVIKEVEDGGMYHPAEVGKVANRVLNGGHAMSQEEVIANNYRQHMIMHESAELRDQIDAGLKSGQDTTLKRIQAKALEEEFEHLTDATKRTGTLTSQALNIRKATLPKYSYEAAARRIFHADPAKPLTEPEKTEIGKQSDIIKKGEKALADKESKRVSPDEKRSQDAGAEAVRELKKQARSGRKEDLDKELQGHIEKLVKMTSHLNAGIDPSILPVLKDIAINRLSVLKDVTAPELVDAVHAEIEKHPQLKGLFTPRQISDGLSGYDRDPVARKQSKFTELKTEMRLLSEIEDTQRGVAREKRIATARAKPPRIEALKAVLKGEKAAAKPPATEKAVRTPAERRLITQRRALGKQIAEYNRRIVANDFSKKPGVSTPDDPEITALKAQRDALKSVYDSMKPKATKAGAVRTPRTPPTRLETLERQAKSVWDKNTAGDYGKPKEAPIPDTPEEAAARHSLKSGIRQRNDMRVAKGLNGPPKDPLGSYKKQLQKRLDQLNGELQGTRANGPKADTRQRDPETEQLKTDIANAQKNLDTMERSRQPKDFQDKLVAYRRFAVLSRVGTLFKLGAAASERMIFSPLEEVTGLPAQLLTGRNVARNAPTQGGFSGRAELAAGKTFFTRKTWTKDAVDKMMKGHHDLEARLGKSEYDEGEKLNALNFMGRLHGAIKTPAQLAAFERAQVKGTAWAERQRLDIHDPNVQAHVDAMAYQESLRAILMQDNVAVGMYKGVIQSLERYDHPAGKATATLMKAAMPIVKVPTNFAGEVGLHVAGGVRAGWEVAGAKLAGKDLTPEQCDIVLRSLKKQGVGGMMFALGYFNADKMGGTYVPGDKPRPQEYGSIKLPTAQIGPFTIGGWTVPHYALHNPAIEAAQLGATFARTQKEGKVNPVYAMGVGMTESVPFLDFPKRAAEVYGGDKKAGKAAGEEIGGMIFPGILNEIGGNFNKDANGKQIKRKPQTFLDEMKMAAGLQSTVPPSSPSSRGGATKLPNPDRPLRMANPRGLSLTNP